MVIYGTSGKILMRTRLLMLIEFFFFCFGVEFYRYHGEVTNKEVLQERNSPSSGTFFSATHENGHRVHPTSKKRVPEKIEEGKCDQV